MNVENVKATQVGAILRQAVEEREVLAIKDGAYVVHRKDGIIGRCATSAWGVSVLYRLPDGAHAYTVGEKAEVVARHWRIATDKEVVTHVACIRN